MHPKHSLQSTLSLANRTALANASTRQVLLNKQVKHCMQHRRPAGIKSMVEAVRLSLSTGFAEWIPTNSLIDGSHV